jgi:hypothetical protein
MTRLFPPGAEHSSYNLQATDDASFFKIISLYSLGADSVENTVSNSSSIGPCPRFLAKALIRLHVYTTVA